MAPLPWPSLPACCPAPSLPAASIAASILARSSFTALSGRSCAGAALRCCASSRASFILLRCDFIPARAPATCSAGDPFMPPVSRARIASESFSRAFFSGVLSPGAFVSRSRSCSSCAASFTLRSSGWSFPFKNSIIRLSPSIISRISGSPCFFSFRSVFIRSFAVSLAPAFFIWFSTSGLLSAALFCASAFAVSLAWFPSAAFCPCSSALPTADVVSSARRSCVENSRDVLSVSFMETGVSNFGDSCRIANGSAY